MVVCVRACVHIYIYILRAYIYIYIYIARAKVYRRRYRREGWVRHGTGAGIDTSSAVQGCRRDRQERRRLRHPEAPLHRLPLHVLWPPWPPRVKHPWLLARHHGIGSVPLTVKMNATARRKGDDTEIDTTPRARSGRLLPEDAGKKREALRCAPAGNRTRGSRMASGNFTTKPQAPRTK